MFSELIAFFPRPIFMNLERFEKIEALVSAIEEQELLAHENRALAGYYERLEQAYGKRYQGTERERFLYFLKANVLRWNSWIAESSNACAHNLHFYRGRLKALLEK